MTSRDQVLIEIQNMPDPLLGRVLDFIRRLKTTRPAPGEVDLLSVSVSSLRKDWDRPEEDEAWAGL